MTITDLLGTELRRLTAALAPHGVPVIIGGGYGLLLRQQHVEASGEPTLRALPEARSTNDLDVFLTVELVADAEKMTALRDVLHELGYEPIDGAKYYQFARAVDYRGEARSLKIDLLAPPPRDPAVLGRMKVDARRVRPRATTEIHAHTTPEAFTIGEHVLALALGEEAPAEVLVPHPFSFLLLKLFAYRDRRHDETKDYGRYHAFDLYRVVAMMIEADFAEAEGLRDRYLDDAIVREARAIVADLFYGAEAPGVLALLEHARTVLADVGRDDAAAFAGDLSTLLPPPDPI